jgi:hypothetical protein
LDNGAKLGVKHVDTHDGVVLEQLLKRGPKLDSVVVIVGDKVQYLGGDPTIDPLYDCKVILHPTRLTRLHVEVG